MAARVELGAGGEVVGELEALVERHPLREGLWASLITALYRAGRQADALAAYARVRRLLVDELGIEPGPELRALEQQVLQQSPCSDGRRPSRVGRGAGQPAAASARRSSAGAERPRPWSRRLVDEHRLVTVVGTRRRRQDPAGARGGRAADCAGRCLAGAARRRRRHGVTWRRWWPRRCTSPGGERSLRERLVGRRDGAAARQLRARRRPTWRPGRLAARRGPAAPRARHQPGAARPRRRARAPRSSRSRPRIGGAVRRPGPGDAASARARRRHDRAGRGGLPRARRAAAGDRARRRAGAVAVGARHRATARRPVRPAARPEQPPARTAPRAGRRDRVELRAAVPRRPARAVGAVVLRRRRLAGRGRARAGGPRRPGGVGRSTRSAGSSTGRWSASTAPTTARCATGCSTASGRTPPSGCARPGRPRRRRRRARRLVRREPAAWCEAHVRGRRQPECLAIARAERANIDAALAWCRRNDPPSASASRTGSAGPGSCSATARPAPPGSATTLTPATPTV